MLLAFDLDSTLVTTDHRLPEAIRQAIFAARERGHHITVLTGRTEASARQYLDLLKVSGPYSTNHGASVADGKGRLMQHCVLTGDTVRSLLKRYQGVPGLEFSCSVGDRLYVRDPEDARWTWAHTLNHELLPIDAYEGEGAEKVVFSCERGAGGMHRELSDLHPQLMYYLWEDAFLEVTAGDAHKGAALKLIAQSLGYSREETVAFGDGINDVTMLAWAGRGVAVGFAHPEVMAVADEHILEPEANGVARWLKDVLLKDAAPVR